MVLGLREQDVDVVADGIDFDEGRIVVFEDAGDVGVELTALLVPEELATALRAEHEVNDDVGEGLGHASDALTGLGWIVGTGFLGLLAVLASAQAVTLRAFGPDRFAG